ncbi:WD40-repeat-containing domain protein [Pyronema domesticum]|nr:WD40-repeat-containing domain protein [Pyronema domesticum]
MTSTTILAAPPSSTTTRANTVSDSDQHSILLNHQHEKKSQTKPFCPRICTTNRIPKHEHGHCPLEHEIHGMCPTGEASPARSPTEEEPPSDSPRLLHRVKHDRSILSLAVSEKFIFAGSQSGEILIWSIDTYQLVATLKGHSGSVLCLCLATEGSLLFSSAGDAIIQVWNADTFENIYTIYSTFDVGDVFCVAYSSTLQTAWFGAQNTSIQWYDLQKKDRRRPSLTAHPSKRVHRFFDSKGPGGRSTPRSDDGIVSVTNSATKMLEIEPSNILQYAHYGYVYCMLLISASQIGQGEGEILLSGGGDGDVKLWNIHAGTGTITELSTLTGGDSGVLSMVVKDTMLYCGLTDGEICIWDLDTLQLVRTVKAHCDDVLTLSMKADCILSGSASGFVRKWNQRFECISRWQAHSGLVLASATTSKNDRLLYITGGNDDCVAIWDVSEFAAVPAAPSTQNDQLLSSLAKFITYRTTLFKRHGATATLLPTDDNNNPIVFARFSGGQKKSKKGKTILFYGHYDVIPAVVGQGWSTDPFELTGVNGYLYGRGVSDNKGPILAALFAAGELAQSGKLDGDIVFLIEGEEESGSRGLFSAVQRHKQEIGPVDYILLANSYWLDDATPLSYLRAPRRVDGSFLNAQPVIELVSLLSTLTKDGKIAIEKFHDPVRPLTEEEKAMYDPIAAALPNTRVDDLLAKWRYPSLTIHRVDVSGPSSSSIIPRSATAAISLRIVPDQSLETVQQQLLDHLNSSYTGNNKLNIKITHAAEPWLGEPGNKMFSALEASVKETWGVPEVLYIREGGSIPGARFLEKEFAAPAAHLPCGQASDGAHLDNERLRLVNLWNAKGVIGGVFEKLTRAGEGEE